MSFVNLLKLVDGLLYPKCFKSFPSINVDFLKYGKFLILIRYRFEILFIPDFREDYGTVIPPDRLSRFLGRSELSDFIGNCVENVQVSAILVAILVTSGNCKYSMLSIR